MMVNVLMHRSFPFVGHQYGWDEVLMFLVPIALAVAGVRYAERRAAQKKQLASGDDQPAPSDET
jgi:hypothetical protein